LPQLNGLEHLSEMSKKLLVEQQELAGLSLLPQVGEKWLDNKIRPKWHCLLQETPVWEEDAEEVLQLLDRLRQVIWIGMDEDLAMKVSHLPEDLRILWPRLAYINFTADKLIELREILQLLDHPALSIPHKEQTKKILTSLKALVEMIPEVEERANRIIYSLKNGNVVEHLQ